MPRRRRRLLIELVEDLVGVAVEAQRLQRGDGLALSPRAVEAHRVEVRRAHRRRQLTAITATIPRVTSIG